MLPVLDLELIKTFLAVWESKGFKPAAEQLNKTPAAISLQIQRLEEILGKRVLERSNQGISLTSAGEIVKEKGQKLISLNYELLGDFQESDLVGQLNFGAPADYAPTLLKKLLPIFRREFPRASPNIILEPSRKLRPKISTDTLDMAIVAQEQNKDEGHPLWSEEIDWYGNASTNDGKPCIGILATDCVLRDHAIDKVKTAIGNHQIVMEATTVASLRDAVEADFCQALLPASLSNGLEKSYTLSNTQIDKITFCLVAGSRFTESTAQRVSKIFKKEL